MRKALQALIAIGFMVGPAAYAKDSKIARLEIVESGFYTSEKTGETRPAAGTVVGHWDVIKNIKFMKSAPAVTAKLGTGFGVRYKIIGERNAGTAHLRVVWKIPAPGIHNPDNGNTYRESVAEFSVTLGETRTRGYSFDKPWEVVKGAWTIQLWQGDRKLLQQSFLIK